jgi:uncharacterized protein YjiK
MLIFCCRGKVTDREKTSVENVRSPYSFQKPDATWELPAALNEISGIGLLNDSIMVCQEDENGLLYLYNLSSSHVDKTIPFGKPNDYEDLAIVGADVYVLQSNGTVLQVANYLQNPVISKFKTALTGKNDTEGLCYDPTTKALLLTCKNNPDSAGAASNEKLIYTFNLQEKNISSNPFLVFEEPEFAPSALAIHPVSKTIFVLSSKKKRLIELSREGKLLNRYDLRGSIFMQPEGLTFAGNGDLYISNEARAGKANILLFRNKN